MSRLIALLVATVLVLAACGGGAGAVAATVNGTDITVGELDALRPGGAATPDQAATDLFLLISTDVVRSGLDELGVEVSDEEVQAAEDEFQASLEASGQTFDDFKEQNQITDDLFELAIFQQAAQEQLLDHFAETIEPTEEEIQAQFDAELQSRSNVCASHILIGTTEEDDEASLAEKEDLANEVFELASEDDADFAALAQEYSTGPTGPDGGDLGCTSPSQYDPTFGQATLDAPVGEPYGPVRTPFGFHVILVNERDVPELEDIRDEIVENVSVSQSAQELSNWFQAELTEAEVTVDPDFGTWETDPATGVPTVVPPTEA